MRDEARCGFYLRVLTPGWLAVGDAWTLESRTRPTETVRRAHEAAFAIGPKTP
jgi:MOSC domain-containing protein YiiM